MRKTLEKYLVENKTKWDSNFSKAALKVPSGSTALPGSTVTSAESSPVKALACYSTNK